MNPANINVEQTLKETPNKHVLDQNDPAIKAKVGEFIKAAQLQQPADQPKPPEIPPSTDFNASPLNMELNPGQVDSKEVEVDILEKAEFLKTLLADDPDLPVRFKIKLLGDQIVVSLRSRTLFEQKRIYNILDLNRLSGMFRIVAENGKEINDDPAQSLMRFQQYCMALMVEEINGKPFSNLRLTSNLTLQENAKALDEFVDAHIANKMGQVRWNILFSAMRLFEGKLAKMSTEANNGDFWMPRA